MAPLHLPTEGTVTAQVDAKASRGPDLVVASNNDIERCNTDADGAEADVSNCHDTDTD